MSTKIEELEELFRSELYLYFHEDFLSEERTKRECEFIEQICETKNGEKILDLACGHGRHANYLSRHYEVVGIDINRKFIELARESASNQGLKVEYLQQDILEIDYSEEFDVILLLFNTFGFFDKEDNKRLIKGIYKSLKAGGRVIIDTKNRDHVVKELKPCSLLEKNEDVRITMI